MATADADLPVLLERASALVGRLLEHHGFALAQPIITQFRTDESLSSGIGVTVRLLHPAQAQAALEVILKRFGGAGVDAFDVA